MLVCTRAIWKVTPIVRYVGRGGGSNITLVRTTAEDQSASRRGTSKSLRLLIDFLCRGKITAAKTKPAECEVCAVLRVLTTTTLLSDLHFEWTSLMDQRP